MHKTNIPDDIIHACIERRGRADVFRYLESTRLALFVIDMQNAWVEPGLSALEIPETRLIVDNINRLARAIRKAGGLLRGPSQRSLLIGRTVCTNNLPLKSCVKG